MSARCHVTEPAGKVWVCAARCPNRALKRQTDRREQQPFRAFSFFWATIEGARCTSTRSLSQSAVRSSSAGGGPSAEAQRAAMVASCQTTAAANFWCSSAFAAGWLRLSVRSPARRSSTSSSAARSHGNQIYARLAERGQTGEGVGVGALQNAPSTSEGSTLSAGMPALCASASLRAPACCGHTRSFFASTSSVSRPQVPAATAGTAEARDEST